VPVPPGWKLVPVEPTATMLTALWNRKKVESPAEFADAYRAMLDVAPKAAPAPVPARCQYCDDTGDVNTPTGEWRGRCVCKAGKDAAPVPVPVPKPEPVAWRFKLDGDLQWQHTDKWQILPSFGKVEPLYTHPPAQPAPVPLPDEKLIDDYLADYELMDGEGGCHTPCFAMSMYASRADRDVAMLAEIDRLLIQRDDYKSDLMAMQRERDALREQLALAETVPMALMDKLDDILSNATMSRTDGEIVDAARLALKEAWPAAPVPDENPKCPDCGHRALGVGCDMRVPHRTTQPAPEVKP